MTRTHYKFACDIVLTPHSALRAKNGIAGQISANKRDRASIGHRQARPAEVVSLSREPHI